MISVRPDLFSGIVPFVCAAEERSFGRAAQSLGVTTAAVSKAVQRLESELGVQLLERSSRAVALTREGEAFLGSCREAVLHVHGARESIQRGRREPHGELACTLPFLLGPLVLPGLGGLSAQYPRLRFRISLSDRIAQLVSESYDVALRLGEPPEAGLSSRLLRTTRWVTVAAPSYLARRPAPASPDELAAHNCLKLVGPNGRPREWSFADGERGWRQPVTGSLLIDHGESLLRAAESGMGLCQGLDVMVSEPVRAGRLTEVLGRYSASGPPIYALLPAGRENTVKVRAFLRYLKDVFAR